MPNFKKLKDLSIFTIPYMYIDHKDFQADNLLRDAGIHMKFKGDYVREDSEYCLILCKVRKRDAGKFEEIMQKLTNKMLLTGHRDYPEVCEKIMQLLEKGAKDMGMSW